jgi:Fic family protein
MIRAKGRDPMGREVEGPLRRGEWKMLPNNPTRPDGISYKYCPPEQVQGEMDRLMGWHQHHTQTGVAPEVEAAWLHHRFTQIHPFQDGNGRVARTLASIVLIRAGWFPLSIHRDDKTSYIDALEAADAGDLSGLDNMGEGSVRPGR